MKYTLIQHTGYSVGGNPQFQAAVELHGVNDSLAKVVATAGGVVFDTYTQASEAEMLINYPHKEYTGLIPVARGGFTTVTAERLAVYVPTEDDKALLEVNA